MAVVIETTIGDITVDLFTDEKPITCRNFLKLCKAKYYNFCLFHTIQSDFIAQTGDPTGTGNGGESAFGLVSGSELKYYKGEKLPRIRHDKPGLLSMVNCGDDMLGSQFFITLGSQLHSLDKHIIFAEVVEGHNVLLKLNEAICDGQHRPYQDIRITHMVVLDDPFEDVPGLVIPDRSPEPPLIFHDSRIGADEAIDDTMGCSRKEIQEMKAEQEATAQATILEIVGDLPDKDIAPPENVLFICKLNPVTTDEDLEIIFSRFGKIKSCEVIRDKQTGNSLQYAFIEFAERKFCEEAYLKMDNVLIDDRRIHVDFSQSIAKIKWKGKGRGVEYFDKKENINKFLKHNHDRDDRKHTKENYKDIEKRRDNRSSRNKRDGYTDERSRNDYVNRRYMEEKSKNDTKKRNNYYESEMCRKDRFTKFDKNTGTLYDRKEKRKHTKKHESCNSDENTTTKYSKKNNREDFKSDTEKRMNSKTSKNHLDSSVKNSRQRKKVKYSNSDTSSNNSSDLSTSDTESSSSKYHKQKKEEKIKTKSHNSNKRKKTIHKHKKQKNKKKHKKHSRSS